jgi:RNA polymerase primary sigma factor
LQSLNENARTVRLPANVINKLYHLNKEMAKFEMINERKPVSGEMLDKDGLPMQILEYPKCSSLNEMINEDGDELIDLISAEENHDLTIDDKVRVKLNETLFTLDEREKTIIECYFGINTGCEPMTLEAIGEKYSLTKERIRQIKEKAIRKLRHNAQGLFSLINE